MKQLNLDQLAAQYAQKIVADGGADIENLITKTLGVLQEQGVYACLLFLFSRTNSKEKALTEKTRPHLYNLLKKLPAFNQSEITDKNALQFFSDNVCNDLDTLLLVKDLYEQTLIYARYGAKAAAKEEKSA